MAKQLSKSEFLNEINNRISNIKSEITNLVVHDIPPESPPAQTSTNQVINILNKSGDETSDDENKSFLSQ